MAKVRYVDEVSDATKGTLIGSAYVKDRRTNKSVFVTSDLHQLGYLRFKGVLPIAETIRRWKTSEGKQRRKVFHMFEPSTELKRALDELDENLNGARDLLYAYDQSRDAVRKLSWRS